MLRERANDAIMSWKARIVGLIEKGIKVKEFSPAVDAVEVAITMIAMIEGAIMITKLTGKLAYRNAVMRAVKKMIIEL